MTRLYKRRILGALTRNYDILENLMRAEVVSIELIDLEGLGFSTGVMTSYKKVGRHDEYSCFDIKYIMTATRVYAIKKISLNLRVRRNK